MSTQFPIRHVVSPATITPNGERRGGCYVHLSEDGQMTIVGRDNFYGPYDIKVDNPPAEVVEIIQNKAIESPYKGGLTRETRTTRPEAETISAWASKLVRQSLGSPIPKTITTKDGRRLSVK